MDFSQCALIFSKYPSASQWDNFFHFHEPYWKYFITNVPNLFPVSINYPFVEMSTWKLADYEKHAGSLSTLEDFFALYFLLINFSHNLNANSQIFFREQEIWKHLWDREFWQGRVCEKDLVKSLSKLKSQLQDKSPADQIIY